MKRTHNISKLVFLLDFYYPEKKKAGTSKK
jgi:hypothetical protein